MRLLISCLTTLVFASPASLVNGRSLQGEELSCDLPAPLHLRNVGSRVDGRGMCVMTSIEMAARWQGLDGMAGLRDWCATEPGGAYPAKVDRQLKEFCLSRRIPLPAYLQYEGRDPRPLLELCERTGRLACITYGWSPRYGGRIAHMTCCPKFGGQWAVCLDCNFPGESSYEWMSLGEMIRRITFPDGAGWVFVWLAPTPPPAPRN